MEGQDEGEAAGEIQAEHPSDYSSIHPSFPSFSAFNFSTFPEEASPSPFRSNTQSDDVIRYRLRLHKPAKHSPWPMQRLGGPLQSTFEMWHEMDRLVERVIAQFTSRSVGLTSDVSLKPRAGAAKDKTFTPLLSVLCLHLHRLCTSIPVWRILSKGFANRTLQPRAKGPLYIYQFLKRKPEAIKKKTNAKMSWTFAEDMFYCVCLY